MLYYQARAFELLCTQRAPLARAMRSRDGRFASSTYAIGRILSRAAMRQASRIVLRFDGRRHTTLCSAALRRGMTYCAVLRCDVLHGAAACCACCAAACCGVLRCGVQRLR